MLFSVLIMTSSVIRRECRGETTKENEATMFFRVKLFVRGSGARYEGPREMNSLEAFYREKLVENDKVSLLDRPSLSNSLVQFEDVIATKKAVVELTTETFVPSTEQGFAFVVFFAPWCKHCQVLKPVFQELAKQMIQTSRLTFATVSSIRSIPRSTSNVLSQVDCTTEASLCSKHAVKGYPTLIWFENGVEVSDRAIDRVHRQIYDECLERSLCSIA